MPSFVITDKCDGCKALDRTACQYVCPNDLMILDRVKMKAYNQEPDMCWECYSCVKICPQQAIDIRSYADFVPMGASVVPLRGSEDIMWTVKFRNGTLKRFKFPIRTVAEGQMVINGGFNTGKDDLDSEELFTEPESLGLDSIPTPKK